MLSPDQPVTSVPYSLGGNGLLAANPSSGGSVSNGSGGSTHSVSGPQSIGSATVGAYARLVANGPTQPSATLVLLTGDSADIVTYYADQPGRLEYAFGAHTFAFPKAGESLADQKLWLVLLPSVWSLLPEPRMWPSYRSNGQTGVTPQNWKVPCTSCRRTKSGNFTPRHRIRSQHPFGCPWWNHYLICLRFRRKLILSMEKERSEYCRSHLIGFTIGKCHRCGCRPVCCPGDQSEWHRIQPGDYGDRQDAGCSCRCVSDQQPRATPVMKLPSPPFPSTSTK